MSKKQVKKRGEILNNFLCIKWALYQYSSLSWNTITQSPQNYKDLIELNNHSIFKLVSPLKIFKTIPTYQTF